MHPLFIKKLNEAAVNINDTPYFWNKPGEQAYWPTLPDCVPLLQPADTNPAVAIGNEYVVASEQKNECSGPYGTETQLSFAAEQVEFATFWATRSIAAAFGITLVEPGQAVEVQSPVAELHHIEYEYGVFAGHWSPYQGAENQLLSVVCTDLEHRDFPHVLVSTDPAQSLVVSVGRYWPKLGQIRLADLWVPRGSALYILPHPAHADPECIDLHGNRNSAHACWGNIQQSSMVTRTLLQTHNSFSHWYWNALPTVHGRPVAIG